jgi:hypothetical protein
VFKESGFIEEESKKEFHLPTSLRKCGRVIRLAILGASLMANPELAHGAKDPSRTESVDVKNSEKWREAAKTGEKLPELVLESLKHLPKESTLKAENVFAIYDVRKFLVGYLVNKGYDKKIAQETLEQLQGLSEFTLDQELPVFIVVENNSNYKQFEDAHNKGGDKSQLAFRLLASDLWHEEQHATKGADEVGALEAQVEYLKSLKASNELTGGDKYLAGQEKRLKEEIGIKKSQISKK